MFKLMFWLTINNICGVPQGSVLGHLTFGLYLLPLSTILMYHKICHHIYVASTQLYIYIYISLECSSTFLEHSFIYVAPCEWNKLSEHISTSNFDCFRKTVKTMLFKQQYGC